MHVLLPRGVPPVPSGTPNTSQMIAKASRGHDRLVPCPSSPARAAGAGPAHRNIAGTRRTSLPSRLTARIEEDVDGGFPEGLGVRQREQFRPRCFGEQIGTHLVQEPFDATRQIHPL